MRADIARSTYNLDGTGVKVGVLSDSFKDRSISIRCSAELRGTIGTR
jgi:hypothetical protein